jgi:hypothetical protein
VAAPPSTQPLYVPNVSVPGKGTRNVVYVVTENDSVYAFDANGSPAVPLWQRSFASPAEGITAVPCADLMPECAFFKPVVGITGTPVIDPTSKTLYVVAMTIENGTYFQRLHALDITTGAEKFRGPVVIKASVPGTGGGSVGGVITFDPFVQNQRPALLLLNGVVYISWSSWADNYASRYHGWVTGYAASTLAQVAVFNDTPNGRQGGIWQCGGGPSAPPGGNHIFLQTGNGTFDANTGGVDYGDSFLKLSTTGGLSVSDYFTPDDQSTLDSEDLDLGIGAGLIPPEPASGKYAEIISAGKLSTIYVINRNGMGKFNPTRNNAIQTVTGSINGYRSSPAYFNNAVYYSGQSDFLSRYSLADGLLSTSPVSLSPTKYAVGSTPSISANGSTNGIVWAIDSFSTAGNLHAYDASDVSKELYKSSQNPKRDTLPPSHFAVPTIANGRVYVGTFNGLVVYGLL